MQKNILMEVVLLALAGLFMAAGAMAGSLDSPAAPTSSNSAMFTLEDVYNKLNTRTNVTMRTGAFTEPAGQPTNGGMHTLNDIMTLVTNRAPVAKTGQTNSLLAGDDATYRKGVAWPNPRFTAGTGTNGTNCVTDNLTGLMWTRNANLAGAVDWTNAVNYCTNMNNGAGTYGYTNWRLPNERELWSLVDFRYYNPPLCNTAGTGKWASNDPFTGVQSGSYWAGGRSMTYAYSAWRVAFTSGYVGFTTDITTYYVWPVRGGED